MPASEIIRFAVPRYPQRDPGPASVLTESTADQAANGLPGKVIRDPLRQKRKQVRAVDNDAIIDRLEGKVAASPPLAAAPRR